jgi:hypothetical protein
MKKARMEETSRTAALAKSFYGDKFNEVFSYRMAQGSGHQVLVRPDAIAKRFHRMNIAIQPTSTVVDDRHDHLPRASH